MGTVSKRIEGVSEKAAGRIKVLAGKLFGDPELQLSGKAKELKGTVMQGFAKTIGWTRGKAQSILGGAKRAAGSATGSPGMEATGAAKQVEGEVRQSINN